MAPAWRRGTGTGARGLQGVAWTCTAVSSTKPWGSLSYAKILLGLAFGLSISVPGPSLFAQSAGSPAGGLWWSVSVEAAGARLTCDVCDRARDLGASVGVATGAYASSQVRVGIEGGGWTHREGDVREIVYTAGVVAEVHPRPTSGLHLLGGLGWSGYRAEEFRHDAVRLRVGVGWDLPLTSSWLVGNRVLLDSSGFAPLDNEGTVVARSVGLSVVRFGVYVRRR